MNERLMKFLAVILLILALISFFILVTNVKDDSAVSSSGEISLTIQESDVPERSEISEGESNQNNSINSMD